MTSVSAGELAMVSAVVLACWLALDQLLTGRQKARKAWALGFAAALRTLAAHPEVVEVLRADPVTGLNAIADRAEQEGQ